MRKGKRALDSLQHRERLRALTKPVLLVVCAVIVVLITLFLVGIAQGNQGEDPTKAETLDGIHALNSVISPTATPDTEGENRQTENTTQTTDNLLGAKASTTTITKDNINQADTSNPELISDIIDPYETIQNELDGLKARNESLTRKYFGESNIFTTETIADRLTATIITFTSKESLEDGSNKVNLHVCTLDYNQMQRTSDELRSKLLEGTIPEGMDVEAEIKKEVAKRVVNGDFEVHYNIYVIVKNNEVIITEELKQAITGNWYTGINSSLQEVACPLEANRTES